MKLHQLSVFVENRPGHLRAPCQALADAGVNLRTLSLAETEHYGILRLIIQDWQRAKAVLEAAGFVVHLVEVVALEVPDHPGGLADVLRVIENAKINVEYMYAFTEKRDDKAVLVFRFNDPDAALQALEHSSVNVLDNIDF
ncbi:MAG: ACT domain-containing protein [Planctomycetaceae bacterium]|nr:ACT domain-containing protein [Planctomycetaceae bacterium]